jgi:hypothetical protein
MCEITFFSITYQYDNPTEPIKKGIFKMKKKLISALLTITMVVGLLGVFPLTVSAVTHTVTDPLDFSTNTTTRSCTVCTGTPCWDWNGTTRTATIILNGRTLNVVIGELAQGMDVAATIINGRTMVPLRFISEALGAEVTWCPINRTVDIKS